GLTENNSLRAKAAAVSREDAKQMSSILQYLYEMHGPGAFQRWVNDSTLAAIDTLSRNDLLAQVADHLGFTYVPRWQFGPPTWVSLRSEDDPIVLLQGFDYLISLEAANLTDTIAAFPLDQDSCFVQLTVDSTGIRVYKGKDRADSQTVILFPLSDTLSVLSARYQREKVPVAELTFERQSPALTARLLIHRVSGNTEGETVRISRLNGDILLRLSGP
ncbi:MAG: hypothetical protein D6800_14200, partial [Candidatus Zixiibacteriota bacterium]